ncbi:MAG: hypothetical protein NT173_04245 [Opitutales bacterium]|nr:hypothetical protein [Opitutales bacterium]
MLDALLDDGIELGEQRRLFLDAARDGVAAGHGAEGEQEQAAVQEGSRFHVRSG